MINAWSVALSYRVIQTACSRKNARKHAQMQARALDPNNRNIIRGQRAFFFFKYDCRAYGDLSSRKSNC